MEEIIPTSYYLLGKRKRDLTSLFRSTRRLGRASPQGLVESTEIEDQGLAHYSSQFSHTPVKIQVTVESTWMKVYLSSKALFSYLCFQLVMVLISMQTVY